MSLETTVKNFIESMKNRDEKRIYDLLAEDVEFEDVPEGHPIKGKQAVYEKFKKFFSMVSQVDPRIHNELYSNDTAMIERENHLVFNGKKVVIRVVTIFKVKNEKVTLFRDYFDLNTFMKQID